VPRRITRDRAIAHDEVGVGVLCMNENLVLDENAARARADISGRAGYVPQGRAARLAPKSASGPRCQGYSRPPTAPRVCLMNTGTPIRAPGLRSPASCPSPATSRAGGGVPVVVRARESRAHGEGGQSTRTDAKPVERATYVAIQLDKSWLCSAQRNHTHEAGTSPATSGAGCGGWSLTGATCGSRSRVASNEGHARQTWTGRMCPPDFVTHVDGKPGA